jgi:hypothetical protein
MTGKQLKKLNSQPFCHFSGNGSSKKILFVSSQLWENTY